MKRQHETMSESLHVYQCRVPIAAADDSRSVPHRAILRRSVRRQGSVPFSPMNLHLDCARSAVLFALRNHARNLHGNIWIGRLDQHGTSWLVNL